MLQAGYSSLRQRRLESDTERCRGSLVAAGAGATPAAFYLGLCRLRCILFPPAPTTLLQAGSSSLPQRWLESDAGRCRRHDCCRRNHSHCRIDDSAVRMFLGNVCSDCQIHPMKSRITAALRLFLRLSLQRLSNSPHEIKNRCRRGGSVASSVSGVCPSVKHYFLFLLFYI